MLENIIANIRQSSPIVHCITNYVTVNDCANILLACGSSPIMADDPAEAADITAVCSALDINIGTLNQNTIPAMLAAGKRANELSHPILLDPVGAGASPLRTNTAAELLNNVRFSVIRGNISEIKAIATGIGGAKGVDADAADAVTEDTLLSTAELAKNFSAATGAVIAITGAVDIIADDKTSYAVRNGCPIMSRITGSGCMLSAMTCAFAAANRDRMTEAVTAAVAAMGLAGEKAAARMGELDGNSTFRNYLIDAIFNMDDKTLREGAKIEKI